MEMIERVATTRLFWDTLGEHRTHARYPDLRAKIGFVVARKADDRNYQSNADAPFVTSIYLAGMWHAKLSANPDIVLFYRLHGDTLWLSMIGSHHDYPHAGKHLQKGKTLAQKIDNAITDGHVSGPCWPSVKWTYPDDLLGRPDLPECAPETLDSVIQSLEDELRDAPIFQRLHGRSLMDESMWTIEDWLSRVDLALEAVTDARVEAASRLREKKPFPAARMASF